MYPAQIPHSLFSAGINGSCLNQNYSIAEGKCQSCQAIKKQADRKNGTDQPALVISVELDALASALFSRIPEPQGQVRSPQLCRLLHCTPNPQRRCQIRSDRNTQPGAAIIVCIVRFRGSSHHRSSSVPVRKDAIRQSGAASGIAFLSAAWYNVCITNVKYPLSNPTQ